MTMVKKSDYPSWLLKRFGDNIPLWAEEKWGQKGTENTELKENRTKEEKRKEN